MEDIYATLRLALALNAQIKIRLLSADDPLLVVRLNSDLRHNMTQVRNAARDLQRCIKCIIEGVEFTP